MPGSETSLIERVRERLREVMDPEIPTVSLVDLGVITDITVEGMRSVEVDMTPTFAGCPAIDYMAADVREKLKEMGFENVEVNVHLRGAWSSDKITEEGRKGLRKFGIGEPPRTEGHLELTVLENIPCPRCRGRNTVMKSPFGPTLCRSIHYCNDCLEAFEQFKPIE